MGIIFSEKIKRAPKKEVPNSDNYLDRLSFPNTGGAVISGSAL
jgi:hypothetical protein